MRTKCWVLLGILLLALPAMGVKKKKQPARGMLERMEAVPCGAKEKGFTGLGSIFGSVGIQDVHSTEKLCPQYLLRTDDLEYHIRPTDGKHPVILPVGKEGEFKIKKDHMFLKVPDGDKKTRHYQVVAIVPLNNGTTVEGREDVKDKHLTGNLPDKNTASRTTEKYPDTDPPRR